jgi:hypothetical protein
MLFSTNDAGIVDQLLREAARSEIMPRFRNMSAHEVRQKSSAMDLVTDADEAAERMIASNRAVFRAEPADTPDLVGLALHGSKKEIDKATKGARLHP